MTMSRRLSLSRKDTSVVEGTKESNIYARGGMTAEQAFNRLIERDLRNIHRPSHPPHTLNNMGRVVSYIQDTAICIVTRIHFHVTTVMSRIEGQWNLMRYGCQFTVRRNV